MLAWDTICRVCSSPAQYEVFAKIPNYLHETSNEFINWQKPINVLIEETTGLKISQDDGLPSSICALCISYLKHASSFRDQVIKNAMSLQVIKTLHNDKATRRAQDKDSLLITEQELLTSEQRKVDTNVLTDKLRHNGHQKVSKELFQTEVAAPSQEYVMQQMRYLNLLFDKDLNSGINEINRQVSGESESLTGNRQPSADVEDYETETTSNDDNDEENFANAAMTKGHIFSYSEKNFEEDDVMNLEELRAAINITIPETCKERKCRACFRRFMFEDSYEEHMEKCIEYKFLVFVEETNLLLDIRRKKAVSPHEFIRRMIFSLRKICDFLKINCDEVLLLPELSTTNYSATGNTTNKISSKDSATATETVLRDENVEDNVLQNEENYDFLIPRRKDDFPIEKINYMDEQAHSSLSQRLLASESPTTKGTVTPISIHNNILYEIERSQSRNAHRLKTTNIELESNVKVMRPIPMHATLQSHNNSRVSPLSETLMGSSAEERMTFLQKLERAAFQTPKKILTKTPLTNPSISVRKDLMPNMSRIPASPSSFSACCNPCNLVFDTLSAFEIHNAVHHNSAADELAAEQTHRQRRNSEEERNRIIAMFENEDI